MKAIQLQIPAQAEYMDLVRICLYGVASKLGYSYEDIEDMKVAVSEACNNAVLYGSPLEEEPVIDIAFNPGDDSLAIEVTNRGPAFAFAEAQHESKPLQGEEPGNLRVGGLGIYLMEALMDEVHVSSEERSTKVRLVKYRT